MIIMKRRRVLGWAAGLTGVSLLAPIASIGHAADQAQTPSQHRGPFYPRQFPVDKDFDLTMIAGRDGVAFGEIVTIFGRVSDVDGQSLSGVMIEIWQVNGHGRYHHEGDASDKPIDPHFQGYGAVLSDGEGRYRFRTVKPVAYPGRAPHIHFALTPKTGRPLVTQMYVAGARENADDFLLNGIRDKARRDRLIVPLEKADVELRGNFDIVLPKLR